jgi:predicted transcriptional regulator
MKPDLYVVARFLDVLWWNQNGIKKTRLQMAVGLNYQTFIKYLRWLKDHELIKIVLDGEGNERIILSENGRESYRRLVTWIRETAKELKF